MRNMLPGNSFPQICVVSVDDSVEVLTLEQDYVRSVHFSNPLDSPMSNLLPVFRTFLFRRFAVDLQQ